MLDRDDFIFTDLDEAILLTNALVELEPPLNPLDPECQLFSKIKNELLQRSLSYISQFEVESFTKIDQWVLIFNALLSKPVLSGNIDLRKKQSVRSIFEDSIVEDSKSLNETP
jgi:hypothetical protein